jgi:hypothetical protein
VVKHITRTRTTSSIRTPAGMVKVCPLAVPDVMKVVVPVL